MNKFKYGDKVVVKKLYVNRADGTGEILDGPKDGKYRVKCDEIDMILHIEEERLEHDVPMQKV